MCSRDARPVEAARRFAAAAADGDDDADGNDDDEDAGAEADCRCGDVPITSEGEDEGDGEEAYGVDANNVGAIGRRDSGAPFFMGILALRTGCS